MIADWIHLTQDREQWRSLKLRVPYIWLLGAFAKLPKATISFIMSVCRPVGPSVHMQQLGHTGRISIKFYI